ncbi:MAG: exodeoxyribonuclease VII large subunit [Saprospiraceae bacterium]
MIAKAQGVIWYKSALFIKKKLGDIFDSIIEEGRQIRFKAKVEFHEIFGLKFSIEDIEPSYTLGNLEMQRQKTIEKLKNENLLYKNQNTILPKAIKNIAVISSTKAAGYQDFISHIENNPYNYRFNIEFYDSSMQGNSVSKDLINNLNKILQNISHFDCVVIIRGGGSKMDLSYFDNYDISKNVAEFPIPVITGIGHDIDKNIIELVAHSPLKTPIAVADYIIRYNMEFEAQILNNLNLILNNAMNIIKNKEGELDILKTYILNQSVSRL